MLWRTNPGRTARRKHGLFGIAATAIGIGAALLVAVAGSRVGRPLFDDSASAVAEKAPLVAVAEPVPDSDTGQRAIVILNLAAGTRRRVGSPDAYTAVAWSPAGQVIAALASAGGPGSRPRLHLVSARDATNVAVPLSEAADWVAPSWAPDGQRLAVVGSRIVMVNPARGSVVSESIVPTVSTDGVREHASGGYAWSPDSRYFAAIVNGWLVLAERDGHHRETPLGDLIPEVERMDVFLLGWRDAASVVVGAATASGLRAYVVEASGASVTAEPLAHGQPVPVPSGAVGPEQNVLQAVERELASGQITRWEPSADGAADVFEVRGAVGRAMVEAAPLQIVIRERKTGASFVVAVGTADTRGGALVDVVMVDESVSSASD